MNLRYYFLTTISSNIFRSDELCNHPSISTQYVSELLQKEKMSVCSSGMQQQRRKKLENKQKFVFDEKDVVPPLRAAVKKSSVQVTNTYASWSRSFSGLNCLSLKNKQAVCLLFNFSPLLRLLTSNQLSHIVLKSTTHSVFQDRIARAREGKDLRTARFDPVLDEVTAKLEKEVKDGNSSSKRNVPVQVLSAFSLKGG